MCTLASLTSYMNKEYFNCSFVFSEELTSIHDIPVFVFTENGSDDDFYSFLVSNGSACASMNVRKEGSEHICITSSLLEIDRSTFLGVLAHEAGHFKCGHLKKEYDAYVNDINFDSSRFEFEADEYSFHCGYGEALLKYLNMQNNNLLSDRITALEGLLGK